MTDKKRDRSSEQTPEAKAKKREYDKLYRQLNRYKINLRVQKWKHDNPERRKEQDMRYNRKKFGPKTVRDWKSEIMPKVKEALDSFTAQGIKPTLRSMHYRLYSLGVINNTTTDYNLLSRKTARAREDYDNDDFRMDCFSDDSRKMIHDFPSQVNYWEPEEYIDARVTELKNFGPNYRKSYLPRWLNQPHYIELWTEKKAMIGTFQSIIGDRQVPIVPFGGYHSVSFLHESAERLKEIQDLGKEIHIIYFGDLDPSGENIQEVIEDKLGQCGVYGIDFKRVAVTDDQIEQFDLPTNPDKDTLDKLKEDPRRFAFKEKHNLDSDDDLFQIEVDALPALYPDQFKAMILDPIDEYFDKEIHKQVLEEHSDKALRKMVSEIVLAEDWETDEDDDDETS